MPRPSRAGRCYASIACTVAWLGVACTQSESLTATSPRDAGADAAQDAAKVSDDAAASVPAPEPKALEVLAEGERAPVALAIDDRYVYWTTSTELRRAPLQGGQVATLATGTGLGDVVAASGEVFITDEIGGTVSRVDREGKSNQVIGRGAYPQSIAVRDGVVYWTNRGLSLNDGSLGAAVLSDGSTNILADGLMQPSGVAADGAFVYFTSVAMSCDFDGGVGGCSGGGVHKVPRAGGATLLVDPDGTPSDVIVGPRGVYWMLYPRLRVMFAGGGNAPATVLAEAFSEEPGPMAVDEDALYISSIQRGRVVRLALDGGKPLPLITDLGTVGEIAVDDAWVYVAATSQGRILRVAKDGSANKPTPITGPCPARIGSAAAIAATPRIDANLELLAMHLDVGQMTASEETYQRVVADVTAIRAAKPELKLVPYLAPDDGKQLYLVPNDQTFLAIDAHSYSAWDCLNDFYGLEALEVSHSPVSGGAVLITLKGLYNLKLLASVYGKLPGIVGAEPNARGGDGPKICARVVGTEFDYVVDRAGGDCPAGCTTHDAYHFKSTAPGQIETLEAWNNQASSQFPDWFTRVCVR